MGGDHYFSPESLNKKFALERAHGHPPELGLALAGGGTKASSFSMGVLQGLTQSGLMEQVDIVSSVSGGGYAALWYFTRRQVNPDTPVEDFFVDCLPTRYGKKLPPDSKTTLAPCPEKPATNYSQKLGADPYRYQNQVRGFQDLFTSDTSPFYSHSFDYRNTTDDQRAIADSTTLVLQSIALIPLNLIMNGVFDWEIDVSMSQYRYNHGIERTYGAEPTVCSKSQACNNPDEKKAYRTVGDLGPVRSMSFPDLATLHEDKAAPLWIINATAGEDRSPLDFKKQKDIALSSFEITPYGSGSGLYGYHAKQLPDLSPLKAVQASAAFLDTQQKVVGDPPLRNIYAALMKFSTFSWGTSYRNNFIEDQPDVNYWGHLALPWPLYYFHRFAPDKDNVFIHLSDGGQSENLGAYALIRRGVPNLIISDHAQDRDGTMADLCRLKSQIKDQGLYLNVPGLADLQQVCGDSTKGYDLFRWQHPILLGCISTDQTTAEKCIQPAASASGYFARIFIIKPALANPELKSAIRSLFACKTDDCSKALLSACATGPSLNETKVAWHYSGLPSCELLAFLMTNANSEKGTASDGCPHFPQHPTDMVTMDSSPWIYGAMRDLGAYYARQISWFLDRSVSKDVSAERFNEALQNQSRDPLEPGSIEQLKQQHASKSFLKCLAT